MAGAGNRLAVGAEGVGGDVQPLLGACLVDRPVPAPAHRLQVAALEQHLHEAAVAGPAAHLGGGSHRILHRQHDRGAQPRVAVQPLRHLPVVGGPRQGRGQLGVPRLRGGRHRVQHRPGNAVGIEEVPAGELQLRAGAAAGRRTRILARTHETRVVAAVGGADAERIQVIAPAARQVGVQVPDGVDLVVQVAVDDRRAHRGGGLGGGCGRPVDRRCGCGLAHDLASSRTPAAARTPTLDRPTPCIETGPLFQHRRAAARAARGRHRAAVARVAGSLSDGHRHDPGASGLPDPRPLLPPPRNPFAGQRCPLRAAEQALRDLEHGDQVVEGNRDHGRARDAVDR